MGRRLRQIQRAEAVGNFAGIVAHDFNNLLQVINGASELACDALSSNSPLRALLDQVSHAGKRAATLVDWLLIISNRHLSVVECLDLNDVVNALQSPQGNSAAGPLPISPLTATDAGTACAPVRSNRWASVWVITACAAAGVAGRSNSTASTAATAPA